MKNSFLTFIVSLSIFTLRTSANIGATDDLWDVSNGTVVTAVSPSASYFGKLYPPETMFGAVPDGFNLEPGDYIFADHQPAGHIYFVEWMTAAPVLVKSFKLYAAGDGPTYGNQREFGTFRLFAKSPGSPNFDVELYDYQATHPYVFLSKDQLLLVSANITPVVTQEFRAEFSARGGIYDGPRIFELDGFGDAIPGDAPPLVVRIAPAVEITWFAELNKVYQVQWKNNLSDLWNDLKTPVKGKGALESVLDSTRNDASRIYRIVVVP